MGSIWYILGFPGVGKEPWNMSLLIRVLKERCLLGKGRIPGVLCRRKLISRYRRTHGPHTYTDCCLARRQPIRTVVYPRVLSRERRATDRQLLFVRTMRARWQGCRLPTSLLKITHCHCLHYYVGNCIMPARSNSSSRHYLSAMYPGVKPVVWRSDAIPQVSLDGYGRSHCISRWFIL
jgi:hypothetical protein